MSVCSVIFILRAPSLQGQFLIVCMLVYTVIKPANVWNKLLHGEYRPSQANSFLCVSPQKWIVCPQLWKQNSFLYTYLWYAWHSYSMYFLSAFRHELQSLTHIKSIFFSFTCPISNFNHKPCKSLFHFGGLHKWGFCYWCKQIQKYTAQMMRCIRKSTLLCLYLNLTKTWPWKGHQNYSAL